MQKSDMAFHISFHCRERYIVSFRSCDVILKRNKKLYTKFKDKLYRFVKNRFLQSNSKHAFNIYIGNNLVYYIDFHFDVKDLTDEFKLLCRIDKETMIKQMRFELEKKISELI